MTNAKRFQIAVAENDVATCMEIAEFDNETLTKKMHTVFNGFDKTLLSKAKNPNYYGVVLHPDGYEMMRAFVENGEAKADLHRWKHMIQVRLPDEEYALLSYYMKLEGYTSKQDFARMLIQEYIAKAVTLYGND